MVGSFYDPTLDEGCAFEELISFHGGLGGPQTRPFILHPPHLPLPDEPIVGAAAVHDAAARLAAGSGRTGPRSGAGRDGGPRSRTARGGLVEQARAAGARDGLRARGDPELAVDRARLRLDRVRGHEQVVGDLAEGQVGGEEVQQPELGGAQRPATRRRSAAVSISSHARSIHSRMTIASSACVQVARGLRELGSRARYVVEQQQRRGRPRPAPRPRTRGCISLRLDISSVALRRSRGRVLVFGRSAPRQRRHGEDEARGRVLGEAKWRTSAIACSASA